MTIPNLKQIVSAQIQRFSGLGAQWPSFPESLEPRFEEETSSRRCGRLWLEGLLAICLYDLLLIADHLGPPPYFMRALVVRAGIITPIALAVNLSMLYRPRKVLREGSIAVVACLAGLTHLWLESNRSPAASAYAQFGVLAVLLFANTLMRLRLPYALATSATMVVGDVVFLHADRMLSYEEKVLGFCLTLSTVVVTVIANYSANRDERMGYLLFLERDMLVEDLNRSNERLTRMAESDALTGLANRHAFNATLLDYWRGDCEERTLLSAIMVDVDHFKQMNDTYGHLYGDKVLQRISRLLVESLRREGDFAARFGG
jgi:predicted signal transduction protein with EAL and GGDEF domain